MPTGAERRTYNEVTHMFDSGIRLTFALALLLSAAGPTLGETPAAADGEPPVPMIEISNARAPLPGVLTGGQPTEEQIEEAAAAGYRTVVNLRAAGEEGSWDEAPKVEELGMRYVSIPVAGAEGIHPDSARLLFDVLEDPSNRPVMVHCGSGNRVGALFALKAFHVDGKDVETALAIGREAGLTKLEETVRGLLESHIQ